MSITVYGSFIVLVMGNFSDALIEAQRQLAAIRVMHQSQQRPYRPCPTERLDESLLAEERDELDEIVKNLPGHIGWGSVPLTAALRRNCLATTPPSEGPKEELPEEPIPSKKQSKKDEALYAYIQPNIASELLRQNDTAAGRVWIMLRALDNANNNGSGRVPVEVARSFLSDKDSEFYIGGKRQLRRLLAEGEGKYWVRTKKFIFLRAAYKVAYLLNVKVATGRPVLIPVTEIAKSIKHFKAHLHASFHSGRYAKNGRKKLIARVTVANEVNGIAPRTQQEYEQLVGLRSVANYAVDHNIYDATKAQDFIWEHQAFKFEDRQGKFDRKNGKRGVAYFAWQLPNSYGIVQTHKQGNKSYRKRLNRQLKALRKQKGEGNEQRSMKPKRFCPSGKVAAKAANRGASIVYWPSAVRKWIWHPFKKEE